MSGRLRSFVLSVFSVLLLFSQPAHAATYTADGDVIGEVAYYTVRKKDNLSEISRRFDIGIVELLAANPGVDPKTLKAGAKLTLPTKHVLPDMPHEGIVLNLPELRLFYFVDDHKVMTFPVGIGREGWVTPTGTTTIILKRKDPIWIPPESIRIEEPNLPEFIPAGPNNPLGLYALNLGLTGYRIHGTNRPSSIGKRASHGCIRLYPEDIEVLFNAVSVGVPVAIIDTPYKLGWQGNTLWLEVTPTQEQDDIIAAYQTPPAANLPEINTAIRNAAGDEADIDWYAVQKAVDTHSGIPVVIAQKFAR